MLDITSAINELNFVKEVHVVAVNNEVKELLFLLEKEYKSSIKIKTINIGSKERQYFDAQFRQKSILNSRHRKPIFMNPIVPS